MQSDHNQFIAAMNGIRELVESGQMTQEEALAPLRDALLGPEAGDAGSYSYENQTRDIAIQSIRATAPRSPTDAITDLKDDLACFNGLSEMAMSAFLHNWRLHVHNLVGNDNDEDEEYLGAALMYEGDVQCDELFAKHCKHPRSIIRLSTKKKAQLLLDLCKTQVQTKVEENKQRDLIDMVWHLFSRFMWFEISTFRREPDNGMDFFFSMLKRFGSDLSRLASGCKEHKVLPYSTGRFQAITCEAHMAWPLCAIIDEILEVEALNFDEDSEHSSDSDDHEDRHRSRFCDLVIFNYLWPAMLGSVPVSTNIGYPFDCSQMTATFELLFSNLIGEDTTEGSTQDRTKRVYGLVLLHAFVTKECDQIEERTAYIGEVIAADLLYPTGIRTMSDVYPPGVAMILDYLHCVREEWMDDYGDESHIEGFEAVLPLLSGTAKANLQDIVTMLRVEYDDEEERDNLIAELLADESKKSSGKNKKGSSKPAPKPAPKQAKQAAAPAASHQPKKEAVAEKATNENKSSNSSNNNNNNNKKKQNSQQQEEQAKARALLEKEKEKPKPTGKRADNSYLPAAKARVMTKQEIAAAPKASPKAPSKPARKEETTQSFTLETYQTVEKLYSIVLVRRLKSAIPGISIKAIVDNLGNSRTDKKGFILHEVRYEVKGPRASVEEAISEIRNQRDQKFPIKQKLDVKDIVNNAKRAGAMDDRIMAIPQHLDCTANYVDNRSSVMVSMLQPFRHDTEGLDERMDAILPRVKEYLSERQAQQHFRDPNRAAGGDEEDEEEYEEDIGSRRTIRGQAVAAEHDPSIVQEFMYRHALNEIDMLPHEKAIIKLKALVQQHKDEWQSDTLGWHRFLYEIEERYAIAMLAQYEMHNHRLVAANQDVFKDMVVCRIDPKTGATPFTERRPSIGVDDVVTVVLGDREFKLRVFFYDATKVNLAFDPKEVSLKELTSAPVSVKFDPVPFSVRCKSLRNGTTNFNEFNWLQNPDMLYKQEELETHIPSDFLTRDVQSGRSGRGRGRGGAGRGRGGSIREKCVDGLNVDQLAAIFAVLDPPPGLDRLTLQGPPGTGKTETLCRLAVLLAQQYETHQRLLIVAPTANAVDVLCTRILEMFEKVGRKDLADGLFRYYSKSSHPLHGAPGLLKYSNIEPKNGAIPAFKDLTGESRYLPIDDDFNTPRLAKVRIVACNISSVKTIMTKEARAKLGLQFGVSHLLIDEAAQTHLSDALSALRHAELKKTFVLLSGDEEQIRPYVVCPYIRSFLQRSVMTYGGKGRASQIVLSESFRASAQLVNLQSAVFYGGKLRHSVDGGHEDVKLGEWSGHNGNPSPGRFYHVESDVQTEGASLVNMAEVDAIYRMALSITKELEVAGSEIVVISKFNEQRRAIRQRLQMVNLSTIRVVDIQDFNGDEREVVLVSLVQQEYEDDKYTAENGFFVRSEINAVIGRGRSLVVFVGNGNTILNSSNRTWKALFAQLKDSKALDGYHYEDDTFEASLTPPIVVPEGAVVVKEFVPATKRNLNDQRKLLTPLDVMRAPQQYFIGSIVVDDQGRQRVRNRSCSAADVLIDLETSIGTIKSALFPGDIVALRIDESRARWLPDNFQGSAARCTPVPVQPHQQTADSGVPVTSTPQAALAALLGGAIPMCRQIEETLDHPLIPVGTVAAVLYHAFVPMVGCSINSELAFPIVKGYPKLPWEDARGAMRSVKSSTPIFLCAIDRANGCYQLIRKMDRALLPSQFPPAPPTIPTGRHIGFPRPSSPPFAASWHPNGRLLVAMGMADITEITISVFIPLAPVMRSNEAEECDAFNTVFSSVEPQPPAGATLTCLHVSFVMHTRPLTGEVMCDNASVDMAYVAPQQGGIDLTLIEKLLPYGRPVSPALNLASNSSLGELDMWAGYIVAQLLVRELPGRAMLLRQLTTPVNVDSGACGLEDPEYYVPSVSATPDGLPKDVELVGEHAPSGFAAFVPVTHPAKRYGDAIALRQASLALKRQTGAPLSREDAEFLAASGAHAQRLNGYWGPYNNGCL